MAKKATLDVLDIQADEITEEKLDPIDLEKERETDPEGSGRQGILSWLQRWRRRLLFLILLPGGLLLISAVIFFGWFYDGQENKQPVTQKNVPASETVVPAADKMVEMAGFVVDLKDQQGFPRIIFCDTVLELEQAQAVAVVQGRVDTRNLIYAILKKKKVDELLSVEGKNRLKRELKDELNGLIGESVIRNIYFTRFEIF